MKTIKPLIAASAVAGVLVAGAASLSAQSALPAGPKVKVVMVTQPGPGLPQYATVDVPMLKEGVPQKSGGRIEVELASWPERNLNGPEIIRLVRSGQVDIGAAPLATVSGDVPFLDIVDLAGLNRPSRPRARSPRPCCPRPTRRSSASTPASSPCTRSRRRCCSAASPSPASTRSRA